MGAFNAPYCAANVEQWMSYFTVVSSGYIVNGRHDTDDCVQECCVEMTILMDRMDPTDPNFSAELKTRVFRRLVDLQRDSLRPTHDVRRERPLEDAVRITDPAPNYDPVDTAVARDLEDMVTRELGTGPQAVIWRELVSPTKRLGRCLDSYRRATDTERQSVPMCVYAEATGLSVRQVRYALVQIRAVVRQIFSTEGGLQPCLS